MLSNLIRQMSILGTFLLLWASATEAQVLTECDAKYPMYDIRDVILLQREPEHGLIFLATQNGTATGADIKFIIMVYDYGDEAEEFYKCVMFEGIDSTSFVDIKTDIDFVPAYGPEVYDNHEDLYETDPQSTYVFVTLRPYAYANPEHMYYPDIRWTTYGISLNYDVEGEVGTFVGAEIMERFD